MELRARPLTAAAFAPFGDVLAAGAAPGLTTNQGTAQRFDFVGKLSNARPQAKGNLAVVRAAALQLPLRLRLLEKHPHSSQAFIPMRCARYLVCVAPTGADGFPELAKLCAFTCMSGQGINYHAGTWHHPLVALDEEADFAMLVWEDGTGEDCVEWPLPTAVTVTG